MCSSDLFLGVLAILFPPLAVWVKCGICSADSIINILLCVLGWVPGLIHAWYIIAKFPDTNDYEHVPQDYERGQGRISYVFVQAPQAHPQPQSHPQPQNQPKQVDYGTTAAPNNGGSSSAPHPPHQGSDAGSSNDNHDRAPPTYAEAVKGDHKIQSDD
ncbi:hypothetical protein F4802DRAFT_224277 [Xylaria palmicola]|nr:hypothetical protein F4802DRAFT_224277 [Xylaria palmicola]